MKDDFNSCFNQEVLNTKSYIAPDQNKNRIRLDSMEHPFALLPEIENKIKQSIDDMELNRYPNSQMVELKAQIKKTFNINPKLSLLLGNGSDELIEMLILATHKERAVFSFNPSFSMYGLISKLFNRQLIELDLDANFQIDIEPTLASIKKNQPSLIFIAQPNNPTGQSFDVEAIEKICQLANGLVVIDEAYFAFSHNPNYFMELLNTQKYPNMLILRTLSKIGFAGIRFGFLIGKSELIEKIEPLRLPYNINSFNQKMVQLALQSINQISEQIQKVCQFRDDMYQKIRTIDGVITYPSETNFLLIQAKDLNSDELQLKLLAKNIAVKNLAQTHPLILNHIRVSMGNEFENQSFISALQKIIVRAQNG